MSETLGSTGGGGGGIEQPAYPVPVTDLEWARELAKRFQSHPMTSEQLVKSASVRSEMVDAAVAVIQNCPNSRERALAVTKLEEACFWANAAIARAGA